MYTLQPRWGGNDGDDYRYVSRLKHYMKEDDALKVGAYLTSQRFGKSLVNYRYELVDWKEVKKGMALHLRDHPNSEEFIKNFIVYGSRYEPSDKLTDFVKATIPKK